MTNDQDREWCVYTGRWHSPDEMTEDHVIPLSLGGSDGFTIRASREGNMLVNRELDEPFKDHPFIANMRRVRGISGRRGRVPVIRWPAVVRGHPSQVNLSRKSIEAESFRSATYGLNSSRPLRGERFEATFTFDLSQMMRFGCRLALGAAHFLFGETFREYGYHAPLRTIMNSPTADADNRFQVTNSDGLGFWAVSWPRSTSLPRPVWQAMCARSKGHLVFTDHAVQGIRLGISLFDGFFRWFFNISTESRRFPIGGDFEQGAVLEIDPAGRMRRMDLRSHLEDLARELGLPLP